MASNKKQTATTARAATAKKAAPLSVSAGGQNGSSERQHAMTSGNILKWAGIIAGVAAVLVAAFLIFIFLASQNTARDIGVAHAPDISTGSYQSGSFYARTTQGHEGAVADEADGGEERKIIRRGTLSLVVGDTDQATGEIAVIAEGVGGYTSDKRIYERNQKKYGTIAIRVPAEMFSSAIKQIKSIALRTEEEHVTASDVTDQLVDLNARLENLRAAEEQYRALFRRSGDVADILEVQKELVRVRGEIERLEAQLKQLTDRVAMASITVSLVSEAEVSVFGVTWSPLHEIKAGVRNMIESIVSFINFLIGLVFYLPVLILWAGAVLGVLWLGWKTFRRVKQKFLSGRM